MLYFVYVLKSEVDGTYYKGSCSDYHKRLADHNSGLSRYTSHKRPWKLIYAEGHPDKRSALIRERKLKHCKADYFEWFVEQPSNLLKKL
jgi:putative endonuclease